MDYSGPRPADLADVYALNFALLACVRSARGGAALRLQLPPSLQPLLAGLTDRQVQRLASAPFLLLSLRERDDVYWTQLLADGASRDLFATRPGAIDECGRIVAATMGFVWQLSRRSPYSARLLFGASQSWCERVAARPLFELLCRTTDRTDLLGLRLADNENFWGRLLQAGLSSASDIRRAAQLCALQTMLTDGSRSDVRRLPTAACSAAVPTMSV
ncbi:MAG: hypothetical protein OEO82_05180 [Gammaproteobacteria bacterium]|nr:hypothetical protein [Gammaproteobacteria bacterium]